MTVFDETNDLKSYSKKVDRYERALDVGGTALISLGTGLGIYGIYRGLEMLNNRTEQYRIAEDIEMLKTNQKNGMVYTTDENSPILHSGERLATPKIYTEAVAEKNAEITRLKNEPYLAVDGLSVTLGLMAAAGTALYLKGMTPKVLWNAYRKSAKNLVARYYPEETERAQAQKAEQQKQFGYTL